MKKGARRKRYAILGLLPLCVAIPTIAMGEVTADEDNVFTLGKIEVSTKGEENKNTTVQSVSSDELRSFERQTVGDALPLLPGVSASTTGARNEQTLYVRGFDIKHVPLFLDGIPIYVPYDGYPDLGRFTTFDLSEIVLSKGFTSVLYGPNTMGGAINMVSRRPEKSLEGDAGIGIKSGETYSAYMNAGTNQGKWYLQVGGSYISSDYFLLSDNFDAMEAEDGDHRENSYYRDEKMNLKLGFTPNSEDEYAFSYIYQHGDKGTPPYVGSDPDEKVRYWRWPYWDKQSYYFTSKTTLPGKSYIKSRIYYDVFKNSLWSYDDATYSTISAKYAFRSHYDDYSNGFSLETGTKILDNHQIKLGLHYKLDAHREQDEGQPTLEFKDQILSAGLEDTITFSDSLYTITGVSYDTVKTLDAQNLQASGEITEFAHESTAGINPQVGVFYLPTDKDTMHASVAMKSRLPSIKDRYSYRLGKAIPNPDLDPERSINYELGYENRHMDNLRWKTTLFYNSVSDYIDLVTIPDPDDPTTTTTQNQNIEDVDIYGVEVEVAAFLFESLELGCNYTYTYADNKTSDVELTNIPEHKLVPYLRHTLYDRLITQLDAEYNSKRYSSTDGDRVADEFVVVNFKMTYDFGQGISADAGVSNMLDENYELEEGYPEPGRTLFANLRYRF
ncbi:TonB-dependent receptor plug domain-containing protein [Desulfogranum japonicum]|uniref:TonB-dependent receptor plug domain-containing protein n=1 Tax=Desulfogranum japonicum TaxID=231447 RepID=UPI000404B22D|nr:TonB-dependent receptor [Desulfogranum japonicum]